MTLYEIDSAIMDCVDEETGEIIDLEKLEALNIERDKKVEGIALAVKNYAAEAKAIKEEEEKLAKRRRSCENAAQRCKDYLSHALDGEKLKTARVSVSYRNSESVTIDDLGSLTEEYIRIPEPQADKTAIKKAIKAGKEVAGAHLETSKSVIVRQKRWEIFTKSCKKFSAVSKHLSLDGANSGNIGTVVWKIFTKRQSRY